MIKLLVILCGLFLSTSVWADQTTSGGHGSDPYLKCMHAGWKASNPTAEQNHQAMVLMQKMSDIEKIHRTGLGDARRALAAALAKHPISHAEANAAYAGIHQHLTPITVTSRDAGIDMINLLSADQRINFNKGYSDCIKGNQ